MPQFLDTRPHRTTLLVIQILIWIYAPLLVLDTILYPSQRYTLRSTNYGARPPVVLSETPIPNYVPREKLRWLMVQPPWHVPRAISFSPWRERALEGSGPFSHFHEVISQPSPLWTLSRFLTTLAFAFFLLRLLSYIRSRLPKMPAFEVQCPREFRM